MALEPLILPRTAQTPEVSVACRPTSVPGSSSSASRTSGSRGSIVRGPGPFGRLCAAAGGRAASAWVGSGTAVKGRATDLTGTPDMPWASRVKVGQGPAPRSPGDAEADTPTRLGPVAWLTPSAARATDSVSYT